MSPAKNSGGEYAASACAGPCARPPGCAQHPEHDSGLASGNHDGTVRLWSLAPTVLTSGNTIWAVAFSPHGHILASGNLDGTIGLWDVTDPARPQLLGQPLTTGSGNYANAVAFSPDGHILASGNHDGTVRLWDVTNPARARPLGQALTTGSSNSVKAVAFSPVGQTLASGNHDGIIRLWNLNVHDAIERICVTAGSLTPQRWHDYIPQLPYQPLCAR